MHLNLNPFNVRVHHPTDTYWPQNSSTYYVTNSNKRNAWPNGRGYAARKLCLVGQAWWIYKIIILFNYAVCIFSSISKCSLNDNIQILNIFQTAANHVLNVTFLNDEDDGPITIVGNVIVISLANLFLIARFGTFKKLLIWCPSC